MFCTCHVQCWFLHWQWHWHWQCHLLIDTDTDTVSACISVLTVTHWQCHSLFDTDTDTVSACISVLINSDINLSLVRFIRKSWAILGPVAATQPLSEVTHLCWAQKCINFNQFMFNTIVLVVVVVVLVVVLLLVQVVVNRTTALYYL